MVDSIPPVDPDLAQGGVNQERERLELRLLEAEAQLKEHGNREAGQRYWLKWFAVLLGAIVVVAMAALLTHLVHMVFWGPILLARSAFSVAMIVAPIASITTITVAIFVGAFRKFEDKDVKQLKDGLSTTANYWADGS